jgi:hypothetical protein
MELLKKWICNTTEPQWYFDLEVTESFAFISSAIVAIIAAAVSTVFLHLIESVREGQAHLPWCPL